VTFINFAEIGGNLFFSENSGNMQYASLTPQLLKTDVLR